VSNTNSDLNVSVLLLLLKLCNELKFHVLHFNTDPMGEHLSTRRLPTRVESKQVVTSICPRNAAFRGMIIRKLESCTHFTVCEYRPQGWTFYPFPSFYKATKGVSKISGHILRVLHRNKRKIHINIRPDMSVFFLV